MSRNDDEMIAAWSAAAGVVLLLLSAIVCAYSAIMDRLDEIEACVCHCAYDQEPPR